ncbi:MAG: hypothetical protein JWP49_2047 [Phenylobacterium sp.]|jgi:hypothetical protein|nr:hypothetical protein [Phenylobacterium sp.]
MTAWLEKEQDGRRYLWRRPGWTESSPTRGRSEVRPALSDRSVGTSSRRLDDRRRCCVRLAAGRAQRPMTPAHPGRESLKKEIRRVLVPHLMELGFQSTRTREGRQAWPGLAQAGYGYARGRDDWEDLLEIMWDRDGSPWFLIFFTSKPSRAPFNDDRATGGEVQPIQSSKLLNLVNFPERWFGRGHEPQLAISLAVSGIDQLDAYLRSGVCGKQIQLTQMGKRHFSSLRMGPVDIVLTILTTLVVLPLALAWGALGSLWRYLKRG